MESKTKKICSLQDAKRCVVVFFSLYAYGDESKTKENRVRGKNHKKKGRKRGRDV